MKKSNSIRALPGTGGGPNEEFCALPDCGCGGACVCKPGGGTGAVMREGARD